MPKVLRNALRVLSVTAILISLSLFGLGLWFVIKPWIEWGLWAIGLGIFGIVIVVVGILMLVARSERNSWAEGQLALQKWAMRNPQHIEQPVRPYATTGPVLEPNLRQVAPNLGDWGVRKLEDSRYYVVLPIVDGQEVWSSALRDKTGEAALFADNYDGQTQAWAAANALNSQAELTAGEE